MNDDSMNLRDLLVGVGAPFSYYPKLIHTQNLSTTECVFLCYIGWKTMPESDGWVAKSIAEIEDETGLSKKEQSTARSKLIHRGFLEEKCIGRERQMHYRVTRQELPETGGPVTLQSAERELCTVPKGNFGIKDVVKGVSKAKTHFQKPSLEEVTVFIVSVGLPASDAEPFWLGKEANGWMNGQNKIRDWKATIRAWKAAGYMTSQRQKAAQKARQAPVYPPHLGGNF